MVFTRTLYTIEIGQTETPLGMNVGTPVRDARDDDARRDVDRRSPRRRRRRTVNIINSDIAGVRSRRVVTRETREEDAGEARCSR
jgi:hypothetical protein